MSENLSSRSSASYSLRSYFSTQSQIIIVSLPGTEPRAKDEIFQRSCARKYFRCERLTSRIGGGQQIQASPAEDSPPAESSSSSECGDRPGDCQLSFSFSLFTILDNDHSRHVLAEVTIP